MSVLEGKLSKLPKDRVQALLAALPPRHENPSLYDQRTSAWHTMLLESLEEEPVAFSADGHSLQCTTASLRAQLSFKGTQPLCVSEIIDSLREKKVIQSVSAYGSRQSLVQSAFAWGRSLLFAPVEEPFVFVALVQKLSEAVEKHVSSLPTDITARIMDLESFQIKIVHPIASNQFKLPQLSAQDMTLLLNDLQNRNLILTKLTANQQTIIKIPSQTTSKTLTETDEGILTISGTLTTLQSQVSGLQESIQHQNDLIQQHLASRLQQIAKMHLRKKKTLEALLLKRIQTADTLENILAKINSAHTDAAILDSYKVATSTLSTLNKELNIEDVHETMDRLADVLADQKEIDDALAAPVTMTNFDEDVLEAELDQLLAEEDDKRKQPVAIAADDDTETLLNQLEELALTAPVPKKTSVSATTEKQNHASLIPAE